MPTAIHDNTTAIAFSVEALRYRILAAEADINALVAARILSEAPHHSCPHWLTSQMSLGPSDGLY
jgi:hypothetical protein